MWESKRVRSLAAALAILPAAAALLMAAPAAADVVECNDPNCTPGIAPNIVLGSYCDNPTYYAFGVTSWGRLVFCGSPRRYEPRWFRSPEMHGIRDEHALCPALEGEVAQAPDGLFLTCVAQNGAATWERGDL
jgi:hypothetical protein